MKSMQILAHEVTYFSSEVFEVACLIREIWIDSNVDKLPEDLLFLINSPHKDSILSSSSLASLLKYKLLS